MSGTKQSNLDRWLKHKKGKRSAHVIPRLPVQSEHEVSRGQERLFLLQKLYPDKPLYQYCHRYNFKGPLNHKLFHKCLVTVSHRHKILQYNFVRRSGKIRAKLISDFEFPWEFIDLTHSFNSEVELKKIEQDFTQYTFDLENDVLFRFLLIKLGHSEYRGLFSIHHILGDRWSLGVIHGELSQLYQNQIPSELNLQYFDYAEWSRSRGWKPEDLEYWKNRLSGLEELVSLPFDKDHSETDIDGKTLSSDWDHRLSEELNAIAAKQGVTMFVLLFALYRAFLTRLTQQTDISVGIPISNRDHPDLEKVVGFFNETVVIRSKVNPGQSFLEVLEETKLAIREGIQRKNVPFEVVVREMNPGRSTNRNPLFQVMFLYNADQQLLDLGEEIVVEDTSVDIGVAKFDLTLFTSFLSGRVNTRIEYRRSAFTENRVRDIASYLEIFAGNLTNNLHAPICDVPIFSERINAKIIDDWGNNGCEIPQGRLFLDTFKTSVREHPTRPAISFQDEQISYDLLDQWSGFVAANLLKSGIRKGDTVGLLTRRSPEMIVGILAILKIGGAYLPLDPDYPSDRLMFMVSDAGVSCILKNVDIPEDLKVECSIISIEKGKAKGDPLIEVTGADPAYLIYTSGSSGQPKGVKVSHENLAASNLARDYFYNESPESFLLISSFSFDSSVVGIFWSLAKGAKLILIPERTEQDIRTLKSIIRTEKPSHSLMLPSLYQTMLDLLDTETLNIFRNIIVAGEVCPPSLARDFFKRGLTTRLFNEYGPTETTVWCIAHEIQKTDVGKSIPIGKPIATARAYVLDDHDQPTAPGIQGNLFIGGSIVTSGYHNRAELNDTRFIQNPFHDNELMYNTGDLVSFRENGIIDFHGRRDNQIKIRGFRVELDEINNEILSVNGVRNAYTKVHGVKGVIFSAFEGESDCSDEIFNHLRATLPPYMIPKSILFLDEFPRLPNGKIDSKSLSKILEEFDKKSVQEIEPARTKTEQILCKIWKDILEIDTLGVKENFFEIGGDSLKSIRMVSLAREEGINIKGIDIFESQTIRELATKIDARSETLDLDATVGSSRKKRFEITNQQKAFYFHYLYASEDQGLLQLRFYLDGDLNPTLFREAWLRAFDLHPVLRSRFYWPEGDDPYVEIVSEVKLPWSHFDYSEDQTIKVNDVIQQYLREDRLSIINLESVPASRLALFKTNPDHHVLIWTCHHILLDGWSAGIILKDVLSVYRSLENGSDINVDPSAGMDYYQKLKKEASTSDTFWIKYLQDFQPLLIADGRNSSGFYDEKISLNEAESEELREYAKNNKITLNILTQAIWLLALALEFDENKISTGITLSGRSSRPDLERLTGLLINVLPIWQQLDPQNKFSSWLQNLQLLNAEIRDRELVDLSEVEDQIKRSIRLDSLFVYGNFMAKELTIGSLTIKKFEGDFSSNFPLTLHVNPLSKITITLRGKVGQVENQRFQGLVRQIQRLVLRLPQKPPNLLQDILPMTNTPAIHDQKVKSNGHPVDPHRLMSPVQASLTLIWQNILHLEDIKPDDDFFALGGTSINAIQLFDRIHAELGILLNPGLLLENSTLEDVAGIIESRQDRSARTIIPLKSSGNLPPIFCLHSGGGHVFFYKPLAECIASDRPLYAISPPEASDNFSYSTIEEMASDYLEAIKTVQQNGPYYLLGTCFSNAVGLEICHQLLAAEDEIGALFIIDSAPMLLDPRRFGQDNRPIRNLISMIGRGQWSHILGRIQRRIFPYNSSSKQVNHDSQATLELRNLVERLNSLYYKYVWKMTKAKVVLVRSSESSQNRRKDFHVTQWQKLSKGPLEVMMVPGAHLDLFEEPSVSELAKIIHNTMNANSKEITSSR